MKAPTQRRSNPEPQTHLLFTHVNSKNVAFYTPSSLVWLSANLKGSEDVLLLMLCCDGPSSRLIVTFSTNDGNV